MVERLDATFQALADPTRRALLARLAEGETTVGDLAAPFDITLAGVSKHLQVLERAGLVSRRRDGRTQLCRLNGEPLAEADRWIRQWERYWAVRLDRLEALLAAEKDPE